MHDCLRFLLLQCLAFTALLHSIGASNVVFFPAQQQTGSKIQPALSVSLDAKGVWYKCGFRTWEVTRWSIESAPPTQEYTTYIVKKSLVRSIGYKGDGQKQYPLAGQGKCTRQVACTSAANALYFNYYERCIVVSSDSPVNPLQFKVEATSKLEIKVMVVWGVIGFVGLVAVLLVLGCVWSCFRNCLCPSRKYTRYT